MLQQNWFWDCKKYEMFEDYAEGQSFYDTETGNIYVVFEEYGMEGSTIIQEITPECVEYEPNKQKYDEWKSNQRFPVYKANRYYSSMTYDTTIILGTDSHDLDLANNLYETWIDRGVEFEVVQAFLDKANLILLTDMDGEVNFGELSSGYQCATTDGKGYVYQIIHNYEGRW